MTGEGLAIRVLVVDDHALWRGFVVDTVQSHAEFRVIGEASDGLEAVRKAQELEPDVVLLDLRLPALNGMEAAKQMRKLPAKFKILFLSQESSADVVREAFKAGANGYIAKMDAGRELLPALNAVLQGKQFLSSSLARDDVGGASNAPARQSVQNTRIVEPGEDEMMLSEHSAIHSR